MKHVASKLVRSLVCPCSDVEVSTPSCRGWAEIAGSQAQVESPDRGSTEPDWVGSGLAAEAGEA
jgi:hypothetical protein